MPGLYLLPGHDHTDYQWKHLVPSLSKGVLTEGDRKALSEYEGRVFGSDWALLPAALPKFQPGKKGERVGTVSEPTSTLY
jgi:hypothetical protein